MSPRLFPDPKLYPDPREFPDAQEVFVRAVDENGNSVKLVLTISP